jgi:hypothetical protein
MSLALKSPFIRTLSHHLKAIGKTGKTNFRVKKISWTLPEDLIL